MNNLKFLRTAFFIEHLSLLLLFLLLRQSVSHISNKSLKNLERKTRGITVQDFKSFQISHYNLSHSATPDLGHLQKEWEQIRSQVGATI